MDSVVKSPIIEQVETATEPSKPFLTGGAPFIRPPVRLTPKKPGIYAIRHKSDKRYIGSAADSISQRWDRHRWHLSKGRHHNLHLQRAWNRDGASAFTFEVIENCAPAWCLALEQVYIQRFKACDEGYNIAPNAGSNRGVKFSEETRRKISTSHSGRKVSAEHRAKISATLKARWSDPALAAKMQHAMDSAKSANPEIMKRAGEARKGWKHTPEAKAAIRAAVIARRSKNI